VRLSNPHGIDDLLMASTDNKYFYHISCLERLLDLRDYIPNKLKLDGGALLVGMFGTVAFISWGSLIHTWMDRKGFLDIKREDAYLKAHKEWEGDNSTWWFDYRFSCEEGHDCEQLIYAYEIAESRPPVYDFQKYPCRLSDIFLYKSDSNPVDGLLTPLPPLRQDEEGRLHEAASLATTSEEPV
jgi:hypothetical protein